MGTLGDLFRCHTTYIGLRIGHTQVLDELLDIATAFFENMLARLMHFLDNFIFHYSSPS